MSRFLPYNRKFWLVVQFSKILSSVFRRNSASRRLPAGLVTSSDSSESRYTENLRRSRLNHFHDFHEKNFDSLEKFLISYFCNRFCLRRPVGIRSSSVHTAAPFERDCGVPGITLFILCCQNFFNFWSKYENIQFASAKPNLKDIKGKNTIYKIFSTGRNLNQTLFLATW